MVVLVAGTGLFLCRGALLRHVAGKKLEMLGQNYGLQIAYRELTMPSLSTVRLEGLTVVPEDRDTLLNLNKVEVDLSLLSLLGGKISVRQVDVEGMTLSFVKEGGISNYDFLFRQKDGEKDDSDTETNALGGYDVRVKQTLHLIFRMLPENGELHNLKVTARRDSLQTRFLIPELILTNSQFASAIQVEEGAMQREWKVRGTLARSMRLIEGSIASADEDEKVMLPYIRPHYNATVEFDSIAFKLSELSSASAHVNYGPLSIVSRYLFDISTELKLSPAAYYPEPSVHSCVLKFERNGSELPPNFIKVLRAAFAMRRKTLRNNMLQLIPKNNVDEVIADAGLLPTVRAEELAVADFVRLADSYNRYGNKASEADPTCVE